MEISQRFCVPSSVERMLFSSRHLLAVDGTLVTRLRGGFFLLCFPKSSYSLSVLGLTWDKSTFSRCWDESRVVCGLSLKTEKTFSTEQLRKSFFKSALLSAVAVSQVKCFLSCSLTPATVHVTEMVTNHRMF